MKDVVIKVEHLSKQYRLGKIGTGTLSHDVNRWWHRIRGKEDPYLKIGEVNDRTIKSKADYVWSLRDINFEIHRGEAIGIIGRNGAGKSTLLKILSRTTVPTIGNIRIRGRVASLLEVGTGFHPELTGRENIFLNGAILGMTKSEIRRKFDEIVDFAGVDKYVDTPVKRYSSGMYVRLAFSVAAYLESEILIVDEVLAVGDAEFQQKCLGKMNDASKSEGRTVLFVSHNMAAIENLCDQSILLSKGSLNCAGKTSVIIDQYLKENNHTEVKNLLEIKERNGVGQVKFREIHFLDEDLSTVESFKSGKKAIVRLFYYSEDKGRIFRNCRISLAIKKDISPLVVLSSELTCKGNIKLNSEGYIDFIIESWPFSQGVYDLTLFLESNSDVQDWITLGKYLNVVDGDFYGSGVNYPIGWQGKTVLIKHQIDIH